MPAVSTDDLFLARRIADVSAELLQASVHQRYKLRRAIVITSNRTSRSGPACSAMRR